MSNISNLSTMAPSSAAPKTPSHVATPPADATDVEEEIVSPNAPLLQLSRDAVPDQIVQIPAGLFKSLVKSIDSVGVLEQKISVLEAKIVASEAKLVDSEVQILSLRRDLYVIIVNLGGKFSLFTKLPLEIRRRIWQFSINRRRLISIFPAKSDSDLPALYDRVTNSGRAELQACKESRIEALNILQLVQRPPFGRSSHITLSHYHPYLDVLWVLDGWTPFPWQIFNDSRLRTRSGSYPQFTTVAFSLRQLKTQIDELVIEKILDNLFIRGDQTLVLFVRQGPANCDSHHQFVELELTPYECFQSRSSGQIDLTYWDNIFNNTTNTLWGAESWDDGKCKSCHQFLRDHTWSDLAGHFQDVFKTVYDEHTNLRNQSIADGMTEAEMSTHDSDTLYWASRCHKWQIPTVKIMLLMERREPDKFETWYLGRW